MPTCPNCQAEVISDAQFCEACGYRLGQAAQQGSVEVRNVERPAALPGSLRNEIPFLSGAVRQAKARLESWKEQTERDKREARREEDMRKQEEEQAVKKSGKRSIWLMLVGVMVLAAWVWLIIRFPPKANPLLKWQLLQEMRREFGLLD